MHRSSWGVAAVVLALVASERAFAGGLGEAGDVEHARMNALAGGPISARDAELLERWGCYSGTRSAFCEQLNHGASYRPERAYRKNRRYKPDE
jgi:hypothetical protein